jgi:hypothetical protein
MEMNVEKPNVMRLSGQPSPVQITIDQKQLENVEYFNYLGTMIVIHEMSEPGLPWQEQHWPRRRLFTSKLYLHVSLRKKLAKCYVWGTALYFAETWILQKVDQKYV